MGLRSTKNPGRSGASSDLQIAAHILSPFGIRPILDQLAQGQGGVGPNGQRGKLRVGPDNLFIHMTGMSDQGWQASMTPARRSRCLPDRDEHAARHAADPEDAEPGYGAIPERRRGVHADGGLLHPDALCMNLQRMLVNQMILDQGLPPNPVDWGLPPGAAANPWPTPAAGIPAPLTTRDVLRYATMNGAKALRLDGKVGSLTPGKEADIIILDATKINVAPLNQVPGAVVSLMDRTNVETVIVAGKVRKWKGQLLDVDLDAAASAARGLARLPLLRCGDPAEPVQQPVTEAASAGCGAAGAAPPVRACGGTGVDEATSRSSISAGLPMMRRSSAATPSTHHARKI